jgi:hypothetical protein
MAAAMRKNLLGDQEEQVDQHGRTYARMEITQPKLIFLFEEDFKADATIDQTVEKQGFKIFIPLAILQAGRGNFFAIVAKAMAGVINAEPCTGFNDIMDMLAQNGIKIDIRLLAPVLAPLDSTQVVKLTKRISILEEAIKLYLLTSKDETSAYSALIGSVPMTLWSRPGHCAILLAFLLERSEINEPCFDAGDLSSVVERWMQMQQLAQGNISGDFGGQEISSRNFLMEGDFLPANELSQKAINSLAAKLGSGSAGIASNLSAQERTSLFMTMTDDRLGRTQTGRLVRAKVAAALHQQFDTGCSKSLAKLLALDGGETKEMLTDLLFKATGLEKVGYFDQRIISAFTRVLGNWGIAFGHRNF